MQQLTTYVRIVHSCYAAATSTWDSTQHSITVSTQLLSLSLSRATPFIYAVSTSIISHHRPSQFGLLQVFFFIFLWLHTSCNHLWCPTKARGNFEQMLFISHGLEEHTSSSFWSLPFKTRKSVLMFDNVQISLWHRRMSCILCECAQRQVKGSMWCCARDFN